MIGFTGLQIRRFQRLHKDDKSSAHSKLIESRSDGLKTLLTAPKTSWTPWPENKFGYIPHTETERAKFLNENVLPSFYKSQWKWSKNARSFAQQFRSEWRRQYDLHVQLKSLEASLSSLIEEPSDDPLKPNDFKAVIYKIRQIENFGDKIDKCKQVRKHDDEKRFTKSGKIKPGEECAHSFNEKCYSDIASLKNKIADAQPQRKAHADVSRR